MDLDYRFVNGYKRSPHNELLNISLKGENKYLMKNLNCKRCKSAFQNYVYMCYVNVSNSKISVFYIIWIALQALSTQLNKSISYFRECSSIMSYNQMSICNEKQIIFIVMSLRSECTLDPVVSTERHPPQKENTLNPVPVKLIEIQ